MDHRIHYCHVACADGAGATMMKSTEPEAFECRSDFLARIRRAVTWLNENRQSELRALCTNQKDRARAVIALKGAKCRW